MAKKRQKTKLVYLMPNGDKYDVISDTGKYYVCAGGTQFRKSARRGKLMKEEIDAENTEE